MTASLKLWERFERHALADCTRLAQGIADLIGESCGREALPELRFLAFTLAAQSQRLGMSHCARLAGALERCCALLFDGQVDPAQALPLLASGTETLARTIGSAAERMESAGLNTPLQAAAYQLETLFPPIGKGPAQEPRINKAGPDVSINRLRSRTKPRG